MHILSHKFVRVDKKMWVCVPQSYHPINMGVLSEGDSSFNLSNYVSEGTPGSGFFMHQTESRSYHKYCLALQAAERPSYWKMLTGKEFSFKKEIKRVDSAHAATLGNHETSQSILTKELILSSYRSCLDIIAVAEETNRVCDAVHRMAHIYTSDHRYSHVLHRYRRQLSLIEREVRATQLDLAKMYPAEMIDRYREVTAKFLVMAQKCRRIWDLTSPGQDGHRLAHVYFDNGIFDYMQVKGYISKMNTGRGETYYLLPEHILRARSTTDFELLPLNNISFMFHPVGDNVQSEVAIPELGLSFRFSKINEVKEFVDAINNYIATLQ